MAPCGGFFKKGFSVVRRFAAQPRPETRNRLAGKVPPSSVGRILRFHGVSASSSPTRHSSKHQSDVERVRVNYITRVPVLTKASARSARLVAMGACAPAVRRGSSGQAFHKDTGYLKALLAAAFSDQLLLGRFATNEAPCVSSRTGGVGGSFLRERQRGSERSFFWSKSCTGRSCVLFGGCASSWTVAVLGTSPRGEAKRTVGRVTGPMSLWRSLAIHGFNPEETDDDRRIGFWAVQGINPCNLICFKNEVSMG